MNQQKFTFKYWLKLMLTNIYLIIFIIFFPILISQLFNIPNIVYQIKHDEYPFISILGYSLPLDICLITGYKGFIQFWRDIKNNTTR